MLLYCITTVESTNLLRSKTDDEVSCLILLILLFRFGDIWTEESPNFEAWFTAAVALNPSFIPEKDSMMLAMTTAQRDGANGHAAPRSTTAPHGSQRRRAGRARLQSPLWSGIEYAGTKATRNDTKR